MATPIEDLHDFDLHNFDLHIYVGTYCEVSYPGLDAEHPITINYMHMGSDDIEYAIRRATEDIAKYIYAPVVWIEQYLKEQGTDWEKLHELERAIAKQREDIEDVQSFLTRSQESLAQLEQQAEQLRKKLEQP